MDGKGAPWGPPPRAIDGSPRCAQAPAAHLDVHAAAGAWAGAAVRVLVAGACQALLQPQHLPPPARALLMLPPQLVQGPALLASPQAAVAVPWRWGPHPRQQPVVLQQLLGSDSPVRGEARLVLDPLPAEPASTQGNRSWGRGLNSDAIGGSKAGPQTHPRGLLPGSGMPRLAPAPRGPRKGTRDQLEPGKASPALEWPELGGAGVRIWTGPKLLARLQAWCSFQVAMPTTRHHLIRVGPAHTRVIIHNPAHLPSDWPRLPSPSSSWRHGPPAISLRMAPPTQLFMTPPILPSDRPRPPPPRLTQLAHPALIQLAPPT